MSWGGFVQMSEGNHNLETSATPVRIGYLLRMYPRFSQTFVANEIRELERQGVDVHILSIRKPDDGYFHEAVTRVHARAYYLPETPHGRFGKILTTKWRWLRRNWRGYLDARRTVRGDDKSTSYDLVRAMDVLKWAKKNKLYHVHVHFGTNEATVALAANLLGGLSYSMTLHAFDIFRQNVDKALLAKKINHSRFTVTVSQYNKDYMVNNLPGVNPDKIRVNYNGIRLDRFPVQARTVNQPTVFGLGRLIEKKGFMFLVRAIGRLRDEGLIVHGRIGGDGPDEKRLLKEIERLNLSDQFELLGSINEKTVRDWMKRSSCFVLPCVQAKDGNVDALPTVLLEALAAGCPIVTTRISGNPEIVVDNISGRLVPPGDDKALADAIRDMVLNSERAAVFAQAGRRRAEELFDIQKNVSVMKIWLIEPKNKNGTIAKTDRVIVDTSRSLETQIEQAG